MHLRWRKSVQSARDDVRYIRACPGAGRRNPVMSLGHRVNTTVQRLSGGWQI